MNCSYRFLHDSLWKSTSSFFSKKYQWIPSVTFSSLPSIFRIQTHKAVATAQQLTARVVAIQAGSDANHHLSSTGNTEALVPRCSVWCRAYNSLAWTAGRLCSSWELMQKNTKQRLCAHLFVKYSQHHASINQGDPEQPKSGKDHNHPQPNMKSNPIYRFQLLWGGHECLAVARDAGPSNLAGAFHQWNSCALHSIGN